MGQALMVYDRPSVIVELTLSKILLPPCLHPNHLQTQDLVIVAEWRTIPYNRNGESALEFTVKSQVNEFIGE